MANEKEHEFEVEVFSAGTWNGDAYSEDDLDEMAANFEALKDVVKPPIKPGHTGGHGKPGEMAFGWVTALRRQGAKLLATFSQVPDIVYRAIKAGRFKRVSAEILWNFRHAGRVYKRVFSGAAVLGADLPAVTNLADLEAYLTQSSDPESGTFERQACYGFDLDRDGGYTAIINAEKEGENGMDEKEYQQKIADEKAAREKAEAEAKEYKIKFEAEQARQAGERKKTREVEFRAYCEEQVKAGRMTPAARDALAGGLDKRAYSDEAGFAISFEDFKAFQDKQGKILPEGGKGAGDGSGKEGKEFSDAGREVDARAKQYAAEKKVDYSTALKAVLAADPELAKAYESDVRVIAEDGE